MRERDYVGGWGGGAGGTCVLLFFPLVLDYVL